MPGTPLIAVTATTSMHLAEARVHVNQAYIEALTTVGLTPVILSPVATLAAPVLARVSGIVITGGEDVAPHRYGATPHPSVTDVNPERDEAEIAVVRLAREQRIPVLAICRGLQIANVALGGTLVQDIATECDTSTNHDPGGPRNVRVHDVSAGRGSRLGAALGAELLRVNSFHHQSLSRVAEPLAATVRSPDGIIEGAESRDAGWWFLGVQWHPEELMNTREDWDRSLFAAFSSASSAPRPLPGA